MIKYEVIHCAFAAFEEPMVVLTFENDEPFDENNLDPIFSLTQNNSFNWVKFFTRMTKFETTTITVAREVLEQGECRSTSVGDKIRVTLDDGNVRIYACGSPFGWNLEK